MILKTLSILLSSSLILANQPGETSTQNPQGTPRQITVKQVLDGDTFVTTNGEHIRIWGINSPERDEAGFWQAGMFLDMKIRGDKITCTTVAIDRFERTVATCADDGVDIGSYMVDTGYARDYKKYSKGEYQPEEKRAQQAARGLWSKTGDLTPHLKYTP